MNRAMFVTEFSKLSAPSCTTLYGLVPQDLPYDINLTSTVYLVPDALQNFTKCRAFRVAAIHQSRNVFQAHVSIFQFIVIQDAQASLANYGMSFKRKVHLRYTKALAFA
jgi:hypothetical protein